MIKISNLLLHDFQLSRKYIEWCLTEINLSWNFSPQYEIQALSSIPFFVDTRFIKGQDEFVAMSDINRIYDAYHLLYCPFRDWYGEEIVNITKKEYVASVFEILVAVALRFSNEYFDQSISGEIFMKMLKNFFGKFLFDNSPLLLDKRALIERWVRRDYEACGKCTPFAIEPGTSKYGAIDQRDFAIWDQCINAFG